MNRQQTQPNNLVWIADTTDILSTMLDNVTKKVSEKTIKIITITWSKDWKEWILLQEDVINYSISQIKSAVSSLVNHFASEYKCTNLKFKIEEQLPN